MSTTMRYREPEAEKILAKHEASISMEALNKVMNILMNSLPLHGSRELNSFERGVQSAITELEVAVENLKRNGAQIQRPRNNNVNVHQQIDIIEAGSTVIGYQADRID
ncbi:hypothetical protein ABT282_08685 [Streptomyces sp. NPDC000927]|uniref:hypothetical protein n=1 Tax=Streptomyces sp. NPDC000927 TaxID=3154371 RepID=UPI003319B6AD